MATKLLMITYNNQLHKCHLTDNEPKEITIGKEWSNVITFPDLLEQLTVYWDGSSLIFEGKPFNQYFQHNLIEKTIEFYLLDEEKNKIYDIVGKQSILIGNDPFADITIDELRADFVLKSVRNSNSY